MKRTTDHIGQWMQSVIADFARHPWMFAFMCLSYFLLGILVAKW